MSQIAIATFCFGERYYGQVNRMVTEIDKQSYKPTLVVLTDKPEKIINKNFVKTFNISDINPNYSQYSNSYYGFDFSVKRYSLLCALNLGFNKIILTDADAVPNNGLFNEENLLLGFVPNSIVGQVTYNFNNEINTNSMLGKRFLHYEEIYQKNYDKSLLDFMPEDCVQFIDLEMPKFYNFLRTWDECINIKNRDGLLNIPAGNIDEMCFSALKNDINVGNNSDKIINVLINKHDKWYMEGKTNNDIDLELYPVNDALESKKNKKIVTSIYELHYIDERGSSWYKGFHLLTQTIRNIIFENYEYVIYTDKYTYEKHDLGSIFNHKNITIKFKELNSEYYINYLNPIREKRVNDGEIWDRIHCVKNYIEVIYNKIEFLLEESDEENTDVVWIDSGMFGTSCSNAWREKMNEIAHTKLFLDKIFQKIDDSNFIAMKGNHIVMNYEVKDKITAEFGVTPQIIPACLFGGNSNLVIEYLSGYKLIVERLVGILNDFTSEQEILFLMLYNKKIKFFEFDDWDDLQKGVLKIMDLYDENSYQTNTLLSNNSLDETKEYFESIVINENDYLENIETTYNYPMSDLEILEKLIKVSNKSLDNIDMTHNNYMIDRMSVFALYYHSPSGKDHYRLLTYISKLYDGETILDIGTDNGCSAIALSDNEKNLVKSFDIADHKEHGVIDKKNIEFYLGDITKYEDILKSTRFIMLDTNHDGLFENIFYKKLKEINYKGILFLDDIHLNKDMKDFWNVISEEKYDLTIKGHSTGTGIVIFK